MKSEAERKRDNARAFDTFQRFFNDILDLEFKGKLLDLGSGDGSFVDYCKEQGVDAIGIDLADGVDFEKDEIPESTSSYDIVMMYSVIEHVWNPSLLLSETSRCLKPDGVLVVVTPNIDTCGSSFYDDHTHIKPYNPQGLERLMSSVGFKKLFVGLWTVGKSSRIWKMKTKRQFLIGKWLPFSGRNKRAPGILKGRSVTMLAAFQLPMEKQSEQ